MRAVSQAAWSAFDVLRSSTSRGRRLRDPPGSAGDRRTARSPRPTATTARRTREPRSRCPEPASPWHPGAGRTRSPTATPPAASPAQGGGRRACTPRGPSRAPRAWLSSPPSTHRPPRQSPIPSDSLRPYTDPGSIPHRVSLGCAGPDRCTRWRTSRRSYSRSRVPCKRGVRTPHSWRRGGR
jgi:hypothetical protein